MRMADQSKAKRTKSRAKNNNLHRNIKLFILVIFIILNVFALRPGLDGGDYAGSLLNISLKHQKKTTPFNAITLDHYFETNGGFCAPYECPLQQQQPKKKNKRQNRIRDSWKEFPDAPALHNDNQWSSEVNYGAPNKSSSFRLFHRDPKKDQFISGNIQKGKIHDPPVLRVLQRYLQPAIALKDERSESPAVFIDVGANIGYFSAIALHMGATVISFEPFLDNAGVFMNTVRTNQWTARSHHYLNAVSYKTSSRFRMMPTNVDVNLSNMKIQEESCVGAGTDAEEEAIKQQQYGYAYMEAVSLDMVMLMRHPDIQRVNLIKIDVETHEIHVLNGAMHFLCNRIVDAITVEVEYLKAKHGLVRDDCTFETMRQRLVEMGYTVMSLDEIPVDLTGVPLKKLPSDVVFVQQYLDQPPARRLKGTINDPCRDFALAD